MYRIIGGVQLKLKIKRTCYKSAHPKFIYYLFTYLFNINPTIKNGIIIITPYTPINTILNTILNTKLKLNNIHIPTPSIINSPIMTCNIFISSFHSLYSIQSPPTQHSNLQIVSVASLQSHLEYTYLNHLV